MTFMKTITGLAAAGVVALGLATSASASTVVNFSAISDANGEGFTSDVLPGGVLDLGGGLEMIFSKNAWLDGMNTNGNPSGLGACDDFVNGCDGKPTDDVDPTGEVVSLAFSDAGGLVTATITDLLIRSDFHLLFNGEIDVNGTIVTVANGVASGLSITGDIFDFSWVSGIGADSESGFYVEELTATVPLPASALLMLAGLGAVGAVRMKRRAA